MDITLEQAKAFDAIARFGTIQKAAKSLNKGHSAIMYLVKTLEDQTHLKLFDRSGYRNQISSEGEVVLRYCRQLLKTRAELVQVCQKLQTGWEPSLKLVYDGVIDFNIIGDALFKLSESQIPTEIKVIAAYLHEVETQFKQEKADMMVTILPINQPDIYSISLKPIRMLLVAHKNHPLSKIKEGKISLSLLNQHSFIKVRETSNPIGLETEQLEFESSFIVNDFATKKKAILKKLGSGWMPEYLIETELKRGSIKVLNTEVKNEHSFKPRLYHRGEEFIGKTTQQLLKFFKSNS